MSEKDKLIAERQKFQKLLLDLPKTEIHLHLEALATADNIWKLINKNKLVYKGINSKEDLKKRFNITNLEEFLFLYINLIQGSFKSEEDLELLIEDASKYLKENNIVYAEIFFAPSKFVQMGFSFKKMIDILSNGAKKIKDKHNFEIKYLVDVSRSFGPDNAMKNLDLILENPSDWILGIGLGGSELNGPAKDYQKVFEKAISKGMHAVAHAGEDVGPQSIWDAINYLKVERVGHGISAVQDEKLIEHLAKTKIPLEVCPTSNIFTRKYCNSLKTHPVRELYDRGVYVTINTDDPTIFSITLIQEYMNLYNEGIFSTAEIIKLLKNNIYATFLPKARKDEIWAQNEKILK